MFIPELIDKIDDTAKTNAIVPNFVGIYTVVDIANDAILHIIRDI
jgi:hypothetical protein